MGSNPIGLTSYINTSRDQRLRRSDGPGVPEGRGADRPADRAAEVLRDRAPVIAGLLRQSAEPADQVLDQDVDRAKDQDEKSYRHGEQQDPVAERRKSFGLMHRHTDGFRDADRGAEA